MALALQELEIFTEPCPICNDPMGSRGFHTASCSRGIDEKAEREVASEPLIRSLGCGENWPGPFVTWRDMAVRAEAAGDVEKARIYGIIRDKIAAIKGPAAVRTELEEDVRCRRCEEIRLEQQASGGESATVDGVTGRHGVAHEFAEWLESKNLAPSREVVVDRDPGKRYYRIAWRNASGSVGGEVQLFSGAWVRVSWTGHAEWMPVRGNMVFADVFTAQMFLDFAVVDRNWEAAQRVPTKPEKGA